MFLLRNKERKHHLAIAIYMASIQVSRSQSMRALLFAHLEEEVVKSIITTTIFQVVSMYVCTICVLLQ